MLESPRVPSPFNEAVNTSRFVKAFGITALIYSLISIFGMNLLGGGIGAGVGLVLLGVAALAAFLPARRATRVDPVEALRAE